MSILSLAFAWITFGGVVFFGSVAIVRLRSLEARVRALEASQSRS